MKKNVLKAVNIKKHFENTKTNILNGIDLELNKGESTAIMGASGEGKTTLLHIFGALESTSSGDIYINGEKLNKKNSNKIRNKFIGYIFQTYNLLEDLSVLDNILMPAKIARNNTTEIHDRAINLLKEVNLYNKKNVIAKLLSGGEKQRVAIARSFCNNPEVILADEPSGNLDHINSKIIHNLLISFVKKKNKSLIVATHDEELANICDKKFMLKEGILYKI